MQVLNQVDYFKHAEEKLSKIKQHFDRLININMILEVEKGGAFMMRIYII
jgi:ribosome-associated translation inhibitor RaiA